VLDLGRNVIRRLRVEQGDVLQAVPEGSIVVAQQLLPSDVGASACCSITPSSSAPRWGRSLGWHKSTRSRC
jgi:hypothetical protein